MLTLSEQEEVILEMLVDGKELYGLEMTQKSEGRLKLGSIYVYLARLEKNKLVESKLEPLREREAGKARRAYKITSSGVVIYRHWQTYKESIANWLPNPINQSATYMSQDKEKVSLERGKAKKKREQSELVLRVVKETKSNSGKLKGQTKKQ